RIGEHQIEGAGGHAARGVLEMADADHQQTGDNGKVTIDGKGPFYPKAERALREVKGHAFAADLLVIAGGGMDGDARAIIGGPEAEGDEADKEGAGQPGQAAQGEVRR